MQLDNKIALVTGASSGIGKATAKLFAREGARVAIGARRRDELDQVVTEIEAAGGQAVAIAGDIRDESYAKALVDLTTETFGGLDIAFNNAGTLGQLGSLTEISLADWQTTIDVNLTGAFLGARYQVPAMRGRPGASLIFNSSFVGYTVGFPGTIAYAASKAGLIGLVQVLAAELGSEGIRVNAILPGGTETPMAATMMATPESRSFIESLFALKRLAQPEEIARFALYLASDAASFTTGTALLADGGVSINRT